MGKMALQGSGSATLLLVSMLSVLAGSAVAVTYTVGDSQGWTQGMNYNSWAASKTFQKGDILVFNFGPLHTALQVSASDYNSCTSSNSLQSVQSGSGFTLTGDSYFICGTPSHCSANGGAGMNMAVKLSSTPSTPTTPATPTSPTSPTTPSTPSTPTSPGTGSGTGTTPTEPSAASGLQAATTLAVASMALIPLLL